jgi:predicted phosphoribosyltransferase/dienelactone hydrolase
MIYRNRYEAGQLLAEEIRGRKLHHPLILALPRGGVPIAFELAQALNAPLDVLIVRKIGAPDAQEFGIGAMAEDGSYWLNEEIVKSYGFRREDIDAVIEKERAELARRVRLYRGERSPLDFRGREIIVVDDGLATGVSATAACRYLRKNGAKRIIFAAPTCASDSVKKLSAEVDEVFCLQSPTEFYAVGQWYEDFSPTSDEEVLALLRQARSPVIVDVEGARLPGDLHVPDSPIGLVLFAHGSGSSRKSPRNVQVAKYLNRHGIATLLFDLLTPSESFDRSNVFDIPLLASRLVGATHWAQARPELAKLPFGFFGASTGGAAALWAAADLGKDIAAIVSRGGRPDLAKPRFQEVNCPALLIVGGEDTGVIELNEEALAELPTAEMITVPGATHLFEEAGTLEIVCEEAANWFVRFFEEARGKSKGRAA